MKTHYVSESLKVIVHADGGSYLFFKTDLTDAQKSAARDAALADISKKLEAAGVLPLVIAREQIGAYRTEREFAAKQAIIARSVDWENHVLFRDGQPPISFTGELIGKADNKFGSNGNQANRWTGVDIYRTKGGKFVAQICRHTCWQGETDRVDAKSFETAFDVIEWLKEGESDLGSVSQEAVEKAAKIAPEFAESWIEQVE